MLAEKLCYFVDIIKFRMIFWKNIAFVRIFIGILHEIVVFLLDAVTFTLVVILTSVKNIIFSVF